MSQSPTQSVERIFPPNDEPQEIEPGLWRIPVPLPFALRSANIYLIQDGRSGWVVVDAGLGLPTDEAAFRAGMERAGVRMADISALILTHAHPDHIGLSDLIQRESSAPVYMLEGEDDRMYGVWGHEVEGAFAGVERLYEENGMEAADVRASHAASMKTRDILRLADPDTVTLVQDGDEITLGAHRYRALWTPGHSDYHLCLLREDGVFIAGDHVLPTITPNIGFYPQARINPLDDYLGALEKVRDLRARVVLPGHGRPFAGLRARADALRAHHEDRSDTVLRLVRESGGIHAYALATSVFGERLRSIDDRRFALVEMLAHLDYLRHMGRVERDRRDNLVVFRATRG